MAKFLRVMVSLRFRKRFYLKYFRTAFALSLHLDPGAEGSVVCGHHIYLYRVYTTSTRER